MISLANKGKVNIRALLALTVLVLLLGGGAVGMWKYRKISTARESLIQGQGQYDQGQWDLAAKSFLKYLNVYPSDPAILRRYAESCLWSQPLDASHILGAWDAYRRLARLKCDEEEAYRRMIDLDLSRGDYDDARHIALLRMEQAPESLEPALWLARIVLDSSSSKDDGNCVAMLVRLAKRIEAAGEKVSQHAQACRLASLLILRSTAEPTENARLARQWADRAVECNDSSVLAHVYRAQFLRGNRQALGLSLDEATALIAQDLTKAAALDVADPSDWLSICEVWTQIGHYDEAAAALAHAAAANAQTCWRFGSDADIWRTNLFAQMVRLGIVSGHAEGAMERAKSVLELDAAAALSNQSAGICHSAIRPGGPGIAGQELP